MYERVRIPNNSRWFISVFPRLPDRLLFFFLLNSQQMIDFDDIDGRNYYRPYNNWIYEVLSIWVWNAKPCKWWGILRNFNHEFHFFCSLNWKEKKTYSIIKTCLLCFFLKFHICGCSPFNGQFQIWLYFDFDPDFIFFTMLRSFSKERETMKARRTRKSKVTYQWSVEQWALLIVLL